MTKTDYSGSSCRNHFFKGGSTSPEWWVNIKRNGGSTCSGIYSNQNIVNIYNNVMITDNSQHTTFNLNGKPISTGELKDLGQKRIAVKESYAESMSLKSPFTGLPTPIFLEHTPKIVGWCKVHVTDIGLEFQDSKIIDKTILRKLNQGKIKGASITGIAEIATCSICSSNYIECSHISGDIYEGLTCINSVVQATIVEVSLVKTPVNSECLVNIKQQNG